MSSVNHTVIGITARFRLNKGWTVAVPHIVDSGGEVLPNRPWRITDSVMRAVKDLRHNASTVDSAETEDAALAYLLSGARARTKYQHELLTAIWETTHDEE